MSKGNKVRLVDICDFQGGSQPPKEQWINEPKDGYIRMLQIRDFTQNREGHEEYIQINNNIKTCIDSDVLIARYGASVGKILTGLSGAYNVAIMKTIPDIYKLNKRYLRFFLLSNVFQNYIFSVGSRAAQAGFNKTDLIDIQIPVPPLEIQKKIAQTLDTASELLAMRKQQLTELDNLNKSLFFDMFGDPVRNEKGWSKKHLGDKCKIITGNTPSRKDVENYGNYIEWIKSDNLNIDGIYLSKASEYLSKKGFSICRFVDTPSVLMTCIAGSIKCIGNVGIANRKVAFNQQINAIVPNKNNVIFLYYLLFFSKEYIQSTVNMSLKGILSKGKLSELEFIFPPASLQNRFASIVTKIEEQKTLVQKAIAETQLLFDSLMSEYFE